MPQLPAASAQASRHGIAALALLLALVPWFPVRAAPEPNSNRLPVGGAESTNRPSAEPLPVPDYIPAKPPEGLEVPKLTPGTPEEAAQLAQRLPIKSIVVEGDAILPAAKFRELTQSYEGQSVSVAELEELRQKLTRLLVDAGFINSGAIIPEGAYSNGTLRMRIVRGQVAEVRVRGQGRLREGYIRNRLRGDPDAPFNLNDLQDRFQLLLSDPLISKMNGRLVPGNRPGEGILDVEVVRARPYGLSVFGDNYRPPSIGGEAFGVSGWVRNLTGLGDTLDFTFVTSAGADRYYGGYSLPVTDAGTQVFFRFDEGDSQVVEQPVADLNIVSKVHNLEGGISHPLINTFKRRLGVGALLAIRRNETAIFNDFGFSFNPGRERPDSQATVLRVFQDYSQRWDRHALAVRSSFSAGLDALGATRQLAHPEFFAWLGQAQYAYLVADNGAQLVARGNVQFANGSLLPLERFAVGGVGTVRGYRENQLVRDQGYAFSLELRYPLIGGNQTNPVHAFSLIPFVDFGEARDVGERAETLFSVGLGFNWQYRRLSTEFFYGYAINPPTPNLNEDLQDSGVHFQVRLNLI